MKSLTRSSTDRKVGGVSAGLAQYFNVDPILFRVGFVAGTLATGGAGVDRLPRLPRLRPERRRRPDLRRDRLTHP